VRADEARASCHDGTHRRQSYALTQPAPAVVSPCDNGLQ
jgi:hypothetical protein